MEAYLGGDMRAFEQLLERHRRGVYNFVLRFSGNRATAEELLQDTFIRVVQSAQGFQRRSRFTTWLYAIARNLCIDHLRKQRHRKAASLDQPVRNDGESNMTLLDKIGSTEEIPDRAAHDSRVRQAIEKALSELNPEQREVFLMREQAGLPFEQIAEITHVPVNTVKSRMRYALQNLKAQLLEAGIEPWMEQNG